jgi:acid phosphatase family membrane protein YuiD
MFWGYAASPVIGWFAAGCLKFVINSLRSRKFAWAEIGYGGLPSTHMSVVSTPAFLVALHEGVSHPSFGVALGVMIVVALDAMSLRRRIGQHAAALNKLQPDDKPLREKIGHKPHEVAAGVLTGFVCALALHLFC